MAESIAPFRTDGAHVLAIINRPPQTLLVSLFGVYEAMIVLGGTKSVRTSSSHGRVLQIDLPSRTLKDRTMEDFINERFNRHRTAQAPL
jgi:hypothetical protein